MFHPMLLASRAVAFSARHLGNPAQSRPPPRRNEATPDPLKIQATENHIGADDSQLTMRAPEGSQYVPAHEWQPTRAKAPSHAVPTAKRLHRILRFIVLRVFGCSSDLGEHVETPERVLVGARQKSAQLGQLERCSLQQRNLPCTNCNRRSLHDCSLAPHRGISLGVKLW